MRTSVARLIPSTSECLQPYLLSNLDLVTESLTLIAGNFSVPAAAISYSRCTPVVVSSVTPLTCPATAVHLPGLADSDRRSRPSTTRDSSELSSAADGTPPACSYSAPLCTSKVASPPSSSSMFGPSPAGQLSACPCTTSTPPGTRPSTRRPGCPSGPPACPPGRPPPPRPRDPGWRRCCSLPSAPGRRWQRGSRSAPRSAR